MLASAPKLLILDDPTRGIDVGAKAEIQALVSELAGKGMAVVLISSDLEEVVEGSDRLIVLRDGVVIGELTGEDVNADRVVALLASAPAAEVEAGASVPMTASSATASGARRDIDWQRFLQDYGVYIGVIALIVVNTLQNPNFLTYFNLRLQLVQVVPVAIVSLGPGARRSGRAGSTSRSAR